jgi:hypothetical protein
VALRLAGLDEVLAGELDRSLGGLGAAGDEVDPRRAAGRVFDQQIGQRLGRFGGEEAGMREGEAVELVLDRRVTSASPWPRQETAAPPDPSR